MKTDSPLFIVVLLVGGIPLVSFFGGKRALGSEGGVDSRYIQTAAVGGGNDYGVQRLGEGNSAVGENEGGWQNGWGGVDGREHIGGGGDIARWSMGGWRGMGRGWCIREGVCLSRGGMRM